MKRLWLVSLAVVCLATAAWADVPVGMPAQSQAQQAADSQASSLYNAVSPYSILDPSRFSMHHSYSLSYFSGPRGGQSVGMYMNSIGYQLARPLYLQVDIGLMHNPGALVGNGDPSAGARILPNFSLRYTPSNKFTLMVDVRTMPTYYAPYSGYIPGYGGNFWMR